MKQETLKEAAENYGKIRNKLDYGQLYCNSVDSFKAGAKWQEEKSKDTEIKCKKIILRLLAQLNGGLEYASIVDELLTKEVNLVDRLYKRYCRDNKLNDIVVKNFK